MDFGLSAQTQKFETKTISFRSPVPLDKGNAGAGGDIETITDHRLQKWETTVLRLCVILVPGRTLNAMVLTTRIATTLLWQF